MTCVFDLKSIIFRVSYHIQQNFTSAFLNIRVQTSDITDLFISGFRSRIMPRYVPSELAKLKLKRRRTSLFSERGHLYKCIGFSFMYRVNILDLSKVSAMRIILHCFFLQTLKFVWISFHYLCNI